MTIAEINYHPEADENYMSDRQQAYFRERLMQWREQLKEDDQKTQQRLRTADDQHGDLVDQSVADLHKKMDFISHDRLCQTLMQINAALRRLDDGSYGYCLLSGEEIGIRRLLAYPIATLSVEAQQLRERRRL